MSEPLFTGADMADLTLLDESAMPSTCQVKRRGAASSSGGRTKPGVYANQGSPVTCRLTRDTATPRELEAVGRIGDESAARVALPIGTSVLSGDRIEITTGTDTQTFEVIGDPYIGSYSTNLTVHVQREG